VSLFRQKLQQITNYVYICFFMSEHAILPIKCRDELVWVVLQIKFMSAFLFSSNNHRLHLSLIRNPKAVFTLRTTSYDSAECLDGRCRTTSYGIVRHWCRNWTWFNFCVSVVAMSYEIVRYVSTAFKSMCSITATPDDIVRHRPMSYEVVCSVNTA